MKISSNPTTSEEKGGFFILLWRKLTSPRAGNDDDARREYMTKVILFFNSVVTLIFIAIAIPGWLLKFIPVDTLLILAGMALLFLISWFVAHRGLWRLGGIIPCVILFLSAAYGNYVGGIDAPAMLLYALAIVLAAIVLNTRVQMVFLFLSLVSFMGFGLAHAGGYLPTPRSAGTMFANRVAIVFAALTSISLGVWFLTNQYQRSLVHVRKSAENIRAIFETVTDGIVFTDLSGNVLDLNDALVKLYDLGSKEQVLGRSIFDFIAPQDYILAIDFYQQILLGKTGISLECLSTLLKGHEPIVLEVNAALFLESDGRPAGFVSTVRDITQRKHIETELSGYRGHLEDLVEERTAELKEAYSELESFSYSISHDLRSPLRRIDGFMNILVEDYADQLPEGGLSYINRSRENIQHMSELINDLLAFSRLIRQPVNCRRISPAEIARSVTNELKAGEYHNRDVEVIIQNLPDCEADPVLLRQVYYNLLDNAFKYGYLQGKTCIEIGSKQDEAGQIIYYIADNGIGFDMQYATRLFGVFQRLHSSKEYEGTGIGLATVERIIRRHGGRIWAESEVNRGSTFYFVLNEQ